MEGDLRSLLHKREGWLAALNRLAAFCDLHGEQAGSNAAEFANLYHGERASMVFDVVASRRRQYEERVLPWVASFRRSLAARSLSTLANMGPPDTFTLRPGEAQTIREVAGGLVRYGVENSLRDDDDAVVRSWPPQSRRWRSHLRSIHMSERCEVLV